MKDSAEKDTESRQKDEKAARDSVGEKQKQLFPLVSLKRP